MVTSVSHRKVVQRNYAAEKSHGGEGCSGAVATASRQVRERERERERGVGTGRQAGAVGKGY